MEAYPFIFSNEPRHRLRRHLLFWASWWAFQSFLYAFVAGYSPYAYAQRFPLAALEALLFMPSHMFLAYMLMYVVVPRLLLRGRYAATAAAVAGLFVATGALSALTSLNIVVPLRYRVLGLPEYRHPNETHFFLGLLAGLRGAITVGGIAAAIKLMKYLYAKEQRNLQLQKEAGDAQLQLLKAQVHPHFLFNTLNNIYAQTQPAAPEAAAMLLRLSGLLRFMLYEGDKPLVPLDRELRLLRDYMELEQQRYGAELELSIDLPENTQDLRIAPLLLLPYVENCFKHGASQLLEQPWISLQVHLEGNWMKLTLLNGRAPGASGSGAGIGMSNVARRLQLLYPGRHLLNITAEEEVFIVNLKLELEPGAEAAPARNRISTVTHD